MIKNKLTIFFSLALAALFLAGCETMSAIDRGFYQVAEGLAEEDRVTGEKTLSTDDRQAQIEKGDAAIDEMLSKADKENVSYNEKFDPEGYERISRIFNRVHAVSHLRNEQWEAILLPVEQFNAFTTGGTYIVVFTGLEKAIKSDDELANVIAHEISHVSANHVGEGRSFGAASLLSGSQSTQKENFKKAFTHEGEEEADEIAILYCALAGYDPRAGSSLWERFYQEKGANAGMIQDHPMTFERAENTKKIANNVMHYYSPGKQNPNYVSLLESNVLWQKKKDNSPEAAGSGGGLLALFETAMNTYTQKLKAQTEEMRQVTRAINIDSIQRSLKVIDSKPVGPSTWRVSFQYTGGRPIKDLSIKLVFSDGKNILGTSLRQMSAVVNRGQQFSLHFENKTINTYNVSPGNVRFLVDNATVI